MTTRQSSPLMEMRCSIAVFRGDSVLLVRSVEDGSEVWKLPGGHLRSDEGMYRCAQRELFEETGLDADVVSSAFLLDTRDKQTGRHVAEVVMLARSGTPGEPQAREAGLDPQFVPMAQIPALRLQPPVAQQLRGLFGHDVFPVELYPEVLREKHEDVPYQLL